MAEALLAGTGAPIEAPETATILIADRPSAANELRAGRLWIEVSPQLRLRTAVAGHVVVGLPLKPAELWAACRKEQPLAPTVKKEERKASPLRILVADDNALNSKVVTSLLSRLGHPAEVATNGLEAARRIRGKEHLQGRPWLVALTANAMSSDRADCLAAGMGDHVAKPVGLKQLAAALERAEAGLQNAYIAQTPQAKGTRAGGELGLPAFGGELVAKFFHFRSYYEEAVRFVSVGPVVVLVVAFGWPEVLGRAKLSNDAVRIDAGHFQIPHDFGTLLLLRFRVVENDGTVLGSFVVSLPVPRCGVVNREKHGQNFAKGTRFRIERHLHHLDMLRAAEADFLIGRIGNPPAHISGNDRFDPGHLLKNSFEAPKAAPAQCSDLRRHVSMISKRTCA